MRETSTSDKRRVHQNIEHAGLAVQTRARVIDLLAREEPSVLENSEHIFLSCCTWEKRCAQSSANRLYFQQRRQRNRV